jgi:hypothetical protein
MAAAARVCGGRSANWYDFTVTAPDFERRFAGRM